MSLKVLLSRFPVKNRLIWTQIARQLPSWGPPRQPVDRKDIEFRVIKTISMHDKIDPNLVKIDSHLVKDLGLDSLDLVEICVQIEDEFETEIKDTESEKLLTIKDFVEFLVNQKESAVDQNQCPDIEFKEGMVDRP